MTARAICAKSRFLLRGKYSLFIIILLIYAAIVMIAGLLPGLVFTGNNNPVFNAASLIMSFLLTVLLNMTGTGISYAALRNSRDESVLSMYVFYAFKNSTDAFLKLQLLFTAVSFCISLPSAFLPYFTEKFNLNIMAYYALTLLWGLLARFISTLILMRLIFAVYVVMDNPSTGAGAALKKSLELTKGDSAKLFKLICGFALYYLLSILTLCIGFLFTKPYIETAKAVFYDDKIAV